MKLSLSGLCVDQLTETRRVFRQDMMPQCLQSNTVYAPRSFVTAALFKQYTITHIFVVFFWCEQSLAEGPIAQCRVPPKLEPGTFTLRQAGTAPL